MGLKEKKAKKESLIANEETEHMKRLFISNSSSSTTWELATLWAYHSHKETEHPLNDLNNTF